MKKYLFLIIVATSLTSCFEETIDIDLNEGDPKVIITAWITNEATPQFVTVGKSINYLGAQIPDYIEGASVTLSDEDQSYTLTEKEKGRYYLPDSWAAKLGQNYTIEVNYDNITYSASEKMRAAPMMQNLTYEEFETDSLTFYGFHYSIIDKEGEGDGYFTIDLPKNRMIDNYLERGFAFNDEFIDGELIEDIYTTDFDSENLLGDTIEVQLFNIGAEAVNYIDAVNANAFRGINPFEAPPVNLPNNFSGGAFGYFIVSGMQSEEVVIR